MWAPSLLQQMMIFLSFLIFPKGWNLLRMWTLYQYQDDPLSPHIVTSLERKGELSRVSVPSTSVPQIVKSMSIRPKTLGIQTASSFYLSTTTLHPAKPSQDISFGIFFVVTRAVPFPFQVLGIWLLRVHYSGIRKLITREKHMYKEGKWENCQRTVMWGS